MTTNIHKDVLTTGEIAKICNVAPRTVAKWFDQGNLKGYRIPGSRDRRVPIEQLVRFLQDNGMPLGWLETGHKRILLLCDDREWSRSLSELLTDRSGYSVQTAFCCFEAGVLAGLAAPQAIVVDVGMPQVAPASFVHTIRAVPQLKGTKLIAFSTRMDDGLGHAMLQQGYGAYLKKPFEIANLIAQLSELTSK